MAKPVLFLGNGINRLGGGYNWQDTLQNLSQDAGITAPNHLFNKVPNTVFFEIIYAAFLQKKGIKHEERYLKESISEKLAEFPENKYHRGLYDLGITNILTTNYDYAIEKGSQEIFDSANAYTETRYSLFRRTKAGNLSIWHTHGEINKSNTIMLGFDHYAGSLQKMRSFITTGLSKRYHKKVALESVTRKNRYSQTPFSWVDIFLLNDVYILGFGMDFSEIDIWWLTIYKQRMREKNKRFGTTTYHSFIHQENADKKELEETKIEVLRSLGVTVKKHTINTNHTYSDAYDQIFDQIKSIPA